MMKILCIGDSNTYGYDPRSYIGSRYPAEVRWTDRLDNYEVINCGVNGMTVPREYARQTGLIRMHDPDLVSLIGAKWGNSLSLRREEIKNDRKDNM